MLNNPFSMVQRADQSGSGHGRAFTRGEEAALLAVCREIGTEWHWYEASVLARYTGLRLIDIASLKREDIHGDRIELVPSKTERHEIKVTIPLHPKAKAALDHLPARGFLFEKLAHHYATTKKRTGYTDLIRSAKIEPKGAVLSFHCWRHTFRTRLAEAGVAQDVAMKLGGWTNAATAEIYNHDLTRAEAAIMALD
ncbi:MAG TPA: tyrosine-type recombinase/integrase [Pontiellaceae bacterium]|nr:tyrosine-type recombinase/integrase [Pontiellaceae bacterium]